MNSISVIIPVYNAEPYVRQAVESALDQEETSEVILVEDNSTDDSLSVCEELVKQYSKVKLLRHPDGKNRGAGASRNLGIINAKCDFIAFLDADDYYLPYRFKAAMDLLGKHPDIDGIYDAVGKYIENEGVYLDDKGEYGGSLTTLKEAVSPNELFEAMLIYGKGQFCTDGIIVRKSVFAKTGNFDENLRLHQDTVMWIKMASVVRLYAGIIDRPVSMIRIHKNNRYRNTASNTLIHTRLLMWRTLWDWGKHKHWNQNRRNFILSQLLRYERKRYQNSHRLMQKLKVISNLILVALKDPYIFFSKPYLNLIYKDSLRRIVIKFSNLMSLVK